jgi:hypothetical protein
MFKSIQRFGAFKGLPSLADRLRLLGLIQPNDQLTINAMNGLSNLTFKVSSTGL